MTDSLFATECIKRYVSSIAKIKPTATAGHKRTYRTQVFRRYSSAPCKCKSAAIFFGNCPIVAKILPLLIFYGLMLGIELCHKRTPLKMGTLFHVDSLFFTEALKNIESAEQNS